MIIIISLFIIISQIYSQDCNEWQTYIEEVPGSIEIDEEDENCFSTNDLESLQRFIDLNESLSEFTQLDLGTQTWTNHRLTKLNMYSYGLDTIPNSINELNKLQFLYLSANPIQYMPETIGELDSLERFFIHTSQIQEIPLSIGDLTELKILYLYNNQLTFLPESFGDLSKLEELKIANNSLDSLPNSFGNLHNLKYLDILNNNIQNLPANFEELTELNYINFFNNNLNYFIENLADFEELEILNLENNSIQFLSEEICDIYDSLSYFSINNNNYCPPYPECLSEFEIGYQNLENCDLCDSSFIWINDIPEYVNYSEYNNCFKEEDLEILNDISNFNNLNNTSPFFGFPQYWENGRITELNLSSNSLVGLPNDIQNLDMLRVFDLSNNQLFFLNEAVSNMQHLEELNLLNNPLVALSNTIGNLSNLKSISINSINLDSIPESFGELDSMESIFINSTLIRNIPEGVSNFSNLNDLHLVGNQIEYLPENLCDLPENCMIDVSNNNLCNEFHYDCISYWGEQNCLNVNETDLINEFAFKKVFPNPFNSTVKIQFEIPSLNFYKNISLKIYDINGKLVHSFKDETTEFKLGLNQNIWNADGYPSGVYFICLSSEGIDNSNNSLMNKVIFMK